MNVKKIAEIINWPLEKWHGNCYSIVCKILKEKIFEGSPVYGHYTGPVSIKGYWSSYVGLPFIRHGWILDNDGWIIDPTRWSFVNEDPHVAFIPDHDDPRYEDYDDGGSKIRILMRQPCPEDNDSEKFNLNLKEEAAELVDTLLDGKATSKSITQMQIMWLANAPYGQLGDFVANIYLAIKEVGHLSYIPIDHINRALTEYQVDLT